MTLQDAIQRVLKEYKRPLNAKDIASLVNSKNYYSRADGEPVESKQILGRIKNYPSLFQNINGQIILVEDENWKSLLTSYWYLVNILRGIYIDADVQFLISGLLFYRRLADKNQLSAQKYSLELSDIFDRALDIRSGNTAAFIESLKRIEHFQIGPQGVFTECARLLEKLDDSKIAEILTVVGQLNTSELDDIEFGRMFEYFLTLDTLNTYSSANTRSVTLLTFMKRFNKIILVKVKWVAVVLVFNNRNLALLASANIKLYYSLALLQIRIGKSMIPRVQQ